MQDTIKEITENLTAISDEILNISTDSNTFATTVAWHVPALNYFQLAQIPLDIAGMMKELKASEITDIEKDEFLAILVGLKDTRSQLIPRLQRDMASGVHGYLLLMSYIDMTVSRILGWRRVENDKMPGPLARRLNKISREIDQIVPDKDELSLHVSTLLAAKEAADRLPTDMQELKAVQIQLKNISTKSSEYIGRIKENLESAAETLKRMRELSNEATGIVRQASETYRLTTSVALASSFDDRAQKLSKSVTVWVFVLAGTLLLILGIAWWRFSAMQELLSAPTFDPPRIWIQLALSAFSVGAPIWFAWISTKQIAQRFRLAEDYAFKASVATAYEGYRREARRIDPNFEKALFASALARLDEAPLRLVEPNTPGSPLHEITDSPAVKTIIGALAERISGGSNKQQGG